MTLIRRFLLRLVLLDRERRLLFLLVLTEQQRFNRDEWPYQNCTNILEVLR